MDVLSSAAQLASQFHPEVALDPAHCLHTLNKGSTCEACYAICPVGAIRPGKPPALDAGACQNCLACLPACPVGAFRAEDAVASLLNCAARVEAGPVELVCALHPAPEAGLPEGLGIRVPGCLAGLGTGAYLLLASLGMEKVIARTEACQECAWADLQQHVERQVSRARYFLASRGREGDIVCQPGSGGMVERPLWDAKNPPLSRRDLFRMVAQQGKVAVAHAMEDQNKNGGQKPGRDRLRLIAAEKHLPPATTNRSLPVGLLGFALVSASEACTACGVCARACPTGALLFEKSEDNSTYALGFAPQSCIGCEICARVCAPSAIDIDHAPLYSQVFVEETLVLQEGRLVKCEDCGALTAKREGVKLCALCAYRREHPFGTKLPPGLAMELPARKEPPNIS